MDENILESEPNDRGEVRTKIGHVRKSDVLHQNLFVQSHFSRLSNELPHASRKLNSIPIQPKFERATSENVTRLYSGFSSRKGIS